MPKTILIVEDDSNFSSIISEKLKNMGVNSVVATNSADGYKLLEQNSIDLIWLDHYLVGEETGYDFVSKVKTSDKYKKTPIFLVTNYDEYGNTIAFIQNQVSSENPKSYLEYGIDRYFVKSSSSLDTIFKDISKFLKI